MKWALPVMAVLLLASTGLFIACGGASPSEHYQAGLVAAQEGDWEKARQEFDAAKDYNDGKQRAADAQQKSATVIAAYGKATDAIKSEKWNEAYSQLRIVLGLSPKYQDATKLLTDVTAKLDEIYNAASAAQESGDLAKAIDGFTAAGGYKDSADRLASTSKLQVELATLYGAMKQYESDKDFAKASQAAADILRRVSKYRDVDTLSVGYKEQLYAQSSELLTQNKLRQALQGFQALAAVDPKFKDVQEKIGETQARLKKPQPGIVEVNRSVDSYDTRVTLVSIEVLADGQLKVNLRIRNNGTWAKSWLEDADGTIYILDTDNNRYAPTGWGTAAGPRRLGEYSDRLGIGVGQEAELYILYPALKDASKTFSLKDEVEFRELTIVR